MPQNKLYVKYKPTKDSIIAYVAMVAKILVRSSNIRYILKKKICRRNFLETLGNVCRMQQKHQVLLASEFLLQKKVLVLCTMGSKAQCLDNSVD